MAEEVVKSRCLVEAEKIINQSAAKYEIVNLVRSYFDEFMNQGFNENQALYLTTHIIDGVLNSMNKRG